MNWIITLLALAGAAYNVKEDWKGFAIWLVTNGYWSCVNIRAGQYTQGVLFIVFWLLSLYGMCSWRAASKKKKTMAYLENRLRAADIIIEKLSGDIRALKKDRDGK